MSSRRDGDQNHEHDTHHFSVAAVLGYLSTTKWTGAHPVVEMLGAACERGEKLTTRAMDAPEQRLSRMPELGKYFVDAGSTLFVFRHQALTRSTSPPSLSQQGERT